MKTIKIIIVHIITLSFQMQVYAQNLVLNPGFEEHKKCLTNEVTSKYFGTIPGFKLAEVAHWSTPSAAETADYFHKCNSDTNYGVPNNYLGSQEPRNGDGYSGFYFKTESQPEYREYVQGKLSDPLVRNKLYHVSFYVSLSDYSELAGSIIGIYFSRDSLVKDKNFRANLEFKPTIQNDSVIFLTDKKRWLRVSGKFFAEGGEKFFTIGNFRNDRKSSLIWLNDVRQNTQTYKCYYYIDDVCVSLNANDCAELPEDGKTLKTANGNYYQSGNMQIQGIVKDSKTGLPLSAKLILEEKGVEEFAARFGSLANGKYYISRIRTHYILHASKPGYIPKSAFVTFSNYVESTNFNLVPYEKGAKSELLNYYFIENGKATFIQYSDEELKYLAEFLDENPDLKIRINTHGVPEGIGNETEENIKYVTDVRAREIMEKLLDYGVMPYQVTAKGYGTSVYSGLYKNEIEILSFNPVKKDPIPKFALKGIIYDNQTRNTLNPIFYLTNLKTTIKNMHNCEDGNFELNLHPGNYELSLNLPGYLPFSKTFEMPHDDYNIEIPLIRITEDKKFTIRNILFGANSITIDPSSYPVLDMVAEYMKNYKDIKILIEGHTDGSNERTTDDYLIELSSKRSNAIKEYIISKGIKAERLESKGYGRSKPIADNKTVEGRSQNRRIEFTILE